MLSGPPEHLECGSRDRGTEFLILFKLNLIQIASVASGHSINSTMLEDTRQGLGEAAPRLQDSFDFVPFYASRWQSLRSSQTGIGLNIRLGSVLTEVPGPRALPLVVRRIVLGPGEDPTDFPKALFSLAVRGFLCPSCPRKWFRKALLFLDFLAYPLKPSVGSHFPLNFWLLGVHSCPGW